MKELETIVNEAERARESGKAAALATVVGIEGSAYRLPGARMLIADGKWIAGSISGGCLEDDVVLRAADAVARNEALVTTYDTTSDDDIIFGVGLGCKGIITILIDPMHPHDDSPDFIAFARSCLTDRAVGMSATVIRTQGDVAAKPGAKLLSRAGSVVSDIHDDELAGKLRSLMQLEPADSSSMVTFKLASGTADVFVERIEPPTPLVVFGAGHDAMPVVSLAKALGWHVTLVDHRAAYANADRFPDADRIVIGSPKEMRSQVALDSDTLVLVMTHNYLRDRDLLEILLPSPVRYLGLLGPSRRTDQLLAELQDKGAQPTAGQRARLYAPVGLDIGSETPAEVAMSILSEMQAVVTTHRGGHLRERKRPIHQPEIVADAAA